MPFQKGKSGNPSGRAKGCMSLAESIRKKFGGGEQLIEWMVGIATTAAKAADRIQAIKWLSDHGYGKPVERVEHSGAGGGPIMVVTGVPVSDHPDAQ